MLEQWTYITLALGWALPPIVLQWVVGWRYLRPQARTWVLAILIPTLYLSLADSTALGKVWTISPTHSLGLMIGNVPVEEIVFFLLTNTLVAQSILLARDSHELIGQFQPWQKQLSVLLGRLDRRNSSRTTSRHSERISG